MPISRKSRKSSKSMKSKSMKKKINNTSTKKKVYCKKSFNTPVVNQFKDMTCKNFIKQDKKDCENSFKKGFFDKCNEIQKI